MGVQLNIKNAEVVKLATSLAEAEGLTKTEVVLAALRERQRNREDMIEEKVRRAMAICKPVAERLKKNNITLDTDILYDEMGLPR